MHAGVVGTLVHLIFGFELCVYIVLEKHLVHSTSSKLFHFL